MRISRILLCFLLACSLCLSGCASFSSKSGQQTENTVVSVEVQTPVLGNISQKTSFIGRVFPAVSVYVIALIPGEVTAVYADAGDYVKAGDLLFEVDSTEIELGVRQAESALEVLKASMTLSQGTSYETAMLAAKSALDQAKSNKKWTQDTYDKYDQTFDATSKTLLSSSKQAKTASDNAKAYYQAMRTAENNATPFTFADGTVAVPTISDVDAAQADHLAAQTAAQMAANAYSQYRDTYESQYNQLNMSLEMAELGLMAAEQSFDLVESGRALDEQVEVLQAQMRQAQAGIEIARQKLSYTKITSPIDGIVEQRNVSLYNMASQSSAAYVIYNPDVFDIEFSVSPKIAANLSAGDEVSVEYAGEALGANIFEIAPSASPTTGLVAVKARFLPGKNPPGGIHTKVSVTSFKQDNVLLLDSKCLYYDEGAAYVYVDMDGKATQRFVETGIITGEKAAILNGISAFDRVISSWSPNLTNGFDILVVGED
jgi:HlyD family secretion protein